VLSSEKLIDDTRLVKKVLQAAGAESKEKIDRDTRSFGGRAFHRQNDYLCID
jgi:hypothetical protein